MKSKSLILMVLSLGFGLVAAIGINQIMKTNQSGANEPVQPRGPVVVAAEQMELYTHLTEENVELDHWPVSIIPPEALTSLDQIKDQATLVRLSKGMPIVASSVDHKNKATEITIPDGLKVVAVRVSADQTIGNLLSPGDKVDVIGIFKRRDSRSGETSTISKTFLKALKVFSIGNRTDARERNDENASRARDAIVGLIVTEKQSEQLVFAQGTGTIKLVLRGADAPDDEDVDDLDDILNTEPAAAQEGSGSRATSSRHKMTIIKGDSSEDVTFGRDGSAQRPAAAASSSSRDDLYNPPGRGESNNAGSANRSDSTGINRGIDEDQYRGE